MKLDVNSGAFCTKNFSKSLAYAILVGSLVLCLLRKMKMATEKARK